MRKLCTIILFITALATQTVAQKEIYISQYQHNRYAVNTAFAGANEALTLFGSYRKQWTGVDKSPQAQLFSAHTPLKSEQIALGVEAFNQSYGVSSNSGFAASYTYRVKQSARNWLALSVNVGVSFHSASWSDVPVHDPNDPMFNTKDAISSPMVGLGTAWYGQRFFVGLSTPSFFYTDVYTTGEAKFDPGKSELIATGGYLFDINDQFQIQPSCLVRLNTPYGTIADANASLVWRKTVWGGMAYRTTDEITAMVAVEPIPHFRIAYSIDFTTGDIATYNNGSHEISLRYHFGYKIQTASPKFF
ncbi:MAG: type IX secretion system membrane protein PorP/SprF [Breznakibacter sp.]